MQLRNSQDGRFNYNPEPSDNCVCEEELEFMQATEKDCKDIVKMAVKAFMIKNYKIDAGDIETISDAVSNIITDKSDFLDIKQTLENNDLGDEVFVNLGQKTQTNILIAANKDLTEYQELRQQGLIRVATNPQTIAVLKPFEAI